MQRRAGRVRGFFISPALLIMLTAPYFGEGLSGSTPPLELLLPWNLAFMAALYGCGALVCREIAHRFHLSFAGLVVLGIAYAVWEEALVDRYWFFPDFWADSDIGSYSVVWHTNALLAVHLTVFHTAISICSSVLVVEWLFPSARHRPWVGRPGLMVAGLVLAATPIVYGEFDQRPPTPVLVGAGLLLVFVVALAFYVGRRESPNIRPASAGVQRQFRWLGTLTFTCVLAHWIVTYSLPDSGIPWLLGVVLSLLPVVLGIVLVPRLATTGPYGSDGIRVVVGMLAFFMLLDLLVGFLGRYDMIVGALATAFFVRRLYERRAGIGAPAPPLPSAAG